ncbi:MAG: PQQ-binding-like beta-propeller repeat protein [Bythopirellula sp.]|nr:PQQ-binding-like beta-propeller repeat protein [Bythopirellula sp.]
MKRLWKMCAILCGLVLGWIAAASLDAVGDVANTAGDTPNKEWNQWGGTPERNNVPVGKDIVTEWNVGKFDYRTGAWDPAKAKNIKWVARLGSQTYGNPVVADEKVFIGTNNSGGWIERFPADVDLGCLIGFDLQDGKFLWQHSSEKLPTGRVHDWPLQGICSAAYVEGDRLYYVTSRGEVACLDTEGFHDGENDGEVTDEEEFAKRGAAERKKQIQAKITQLQTQDADNNADEIKKLQAQLDSKLYDKQMEADVVWSYDMMKEMSVSQHNMASCSITGAGDLLFICTSNGVDVEHNYIPAPEAPSFFVMNKNTKEILWTDDSPGLNILHGQWSSPAYAVFDGQPQVIFAGGDGWVYSFDPQGENGKAKLLWKFDANPKESHYALNRATRNHIIATPVIHDGLVYVGVGEDPEHGEGVGHLWCIDPTKRGDVSPELAFNKESPDKPIPHKRLQAVVPEDGDFTRPNPNSAVVWHFSEVDRDGNGKVAFEETMHRTVGTVAIRDNILYIADFSGLFHCLDAKTGKPHWSYDMLAAAWGSPLIVEDKVYIGDEDGEIAVFRHSADPAVAMEEDEEPYYGTCDMGNSVYSTPIVADNVLYVCNRTHLFAITPEGK